MQTLELGTHTVLNVLNNYKLLIKYEAEHRLWGTALEGRGSCKSSFANYTTPPPTF